MFYNPGMGIYQFASVVKSDSARWDRIENLMRPWVKRGKRCIIRVFSCRRAVTFAQSVPFSPLFVKEKGI